MKSRKTTKEVKTRRGAWSMQDWLHHNLNSLHVYCRLVRVMPKSLAMAIALHWEKTVIYGFIYFSK